MKKTLLLIILCSPIAFFAQQWAWVQANGKANSVTNSRIKTTSSGEVLSAYTNSFQPSSILLKRETTGGTLVWSKTIGGMNTLSEDVSIDANNNAYIVGQFANNLVLPDTTLTNGGSYQTFIVAYDNAGVRKWVKVLPGAMLGQNFILNDNTGNLVYAAATPSALTVIKYNNAGTQLYQKNYSSTSGLKDLEIDMQNNIHIAGTFQNSGLTLAGTSYYPAGNTGFQYTTFIAKLNPAGDIKKVHTYPGVYLKGFEMDNTSANYYLGGYFSDSARIGNTKIYTACNTNTNSPAICEERFLAKVDTNDIGAWAKKSLTWYYADIDVSGTGSIYLAGKFIDSLSMDGVKLKETVGQRYATFVAKISSAGIAQWAVKDSGSATTTSTYPEDIAYSSNGSIYLSGTFHNFQGNSYLGSLTLPITGTVSNYFDAKLLDTNTPTGLTAFTNKDNSIKVHPNPTNGKFSVNGTISAIYDILGNIIYNGSGIDEKEFDLSGKPRGIYFVELKEGEIRTVKKLILE